MRQHRIFSTMRAHEYIDLCVEISNINEQIIKSDYSRLIVTLVCSSGTDYTQLLVRVVIK